MYNALCEEQHGFWPNRSCETQLITTINDFVECLNEGSQCDVLLLDFSKPFDKVPQTRLCRKLHHYGIRGTLLSWLHAFLFNRSQYVVLDNQNSDPTHVLSGVPQGMVLAPLLFLIYINDLPSCVHNKVRLYANDVLLYSHIYSNNDCIPTCNRTWAHLLIGRIPGKCHLTLRNVNSYVLPTKLISCYPKLFHRILTY